MVILLFYQRLCRKKNSFVSSRNQNNKYWWKFVYPQCPSLKVKKDLIFISPSLVYSNSFLYLIITEYLFCDKPSWEVDSVWGEKSVLGKGTSVRVGQEW